VNSNAVNYTGAGAQTVVGTTYYNLTKSGIGTASTAGAITVNGTLTVSAGVFSAGAFALTAVGTTSVTGTLTVTSATGTKSFQDIILNAGSTWNTNAVVTYTFLGNLTMSGATITGTFAGTIPVAGTLTITNATVNTISTEIIAITGTTTVAGTLSLTTSGAKTFSNLVINSTGTFTNTANNLVVTITGNIQNDGTLNSGTGVYTLNGATNTISGVNPVAISSITFNTGSSYTNNGTLTVATALAGVGSLTQGSNSNLNIGGTSAITTLVATTNPNMVTFNGGTAQTITLPRTFYNLTISNSFGVSISSSQNLLGTLTLASGAFTTTGQTFTLVSNSSGTASIGTITGGSIVGNITMQRYISGITDWRFLGAPITGATLAQWAAIIATSGFTGSTDPTASFNSIYTYDETVTGTFNNGFVGATNITNPITAAKGYWCYVGPAPVTLSVAGPPITGSQSIPVTYTSSAGAADDGWNMVSNPYPSTIDWSSAAWTKTNINDAIYIWNSAAQQYASYVSGIGLNGGSQYIPSSQGFWVQTNATSPVLSLTEAVKAADQPFIRTSSGQKLKNSFKLIVNGNNYKDETVIRFIKGATPGFDNQFDASKMFSLNSLVPSISSIVGGSDLSINSFPEISADISIPVRVKVGVSGNYQISSDSSLQNMPLSSCLLLEDLKTGMKTDLRTIVNYSFFISNTDTAIRFLIHVGAPMLKQSISPHCNGAKNGKAIATIQGQGPFTYVWKDSIGNVIQTHTTIYGTDTLSNLVAGIYNVNVKDSNSLCGTLSDTVLVSQPDVITETAITTNVSCNGVTGGSIQLNVSGGNSPYSFSWSNSSSAQNATNLSAGNYTVNITDQTGCTASNSYSISQPPTVVSAFTVTKDTIDLTFNDTARFINASQGASQLYWNFGDATGADGTINPAHSYSNTGKYNVRLIASNGQCSDTSYHYITVIQSSPLGINKSAWNQEQPQIISVNGETSIHFNFESLTNVNISLINMLGEQLIPGFEVSVKDDKIMIDVEDKPAGIYFLIIDAKDKRYSKKIVL